MPNWARLDSNQRRQMPTGLQPVPFNHSGTRPESILSGQALYQSVWASQYDPPRLSVKCCQEYRLEPVIKHLDECGGNR